MAAAAPARLRLDNAFALEPHNVGVVVLLLKEWVFWGNRPLRLIRSSREIRSRGARRLRTWRVPSFCGIMRRQIPSHPAFVYLVEQTLCLPNKLVLAEADRIRSGQINKSPFSILVDKLDGMSVTALSSSNMSFYDPHEKAVPCYLQSTIAQGFCSSDC
jgi:hypothetical protein